MFKKKNQIFILIFVIFHFSEGLRQELESIRWETLHRAAVSIQSAWRAFQARKKWPHLKRLLLQQAQAPAPPPLPPAPPTAPPPHPNPNKGKLLKNLIFKIDENRAYSVGWSPRSRGIFQSNNNSTVFGMFQLVIVMMLDSSGDTSCIRCEMSGTSALKIWFSPEAYARLSFRPWPK